MHYRFKVVIPPFCSEYPIVFFAKTALESEPINEACLAFSRNHFWRSVIRYGTSQKELEKYHIVRVENSTKDSINLVDNVIRVCSSPCNPAVLRGRIKGLQGLL